ncbi:hypothetical protein BV898_12385 [Hypsibius exemplaris]|uniref:Uncharacterized protein n=1 Tax=Hypsibius exemplaris TaxID=2072580 RepID=A0A1W0WDZ3_HYPEX|nr:hypothetical protein BV898_12385 [Hypsibius exemplaris]
MANSFCFTVPLFVLLAHCFVSGQDGTLRDTEFNNRPASLYRPAWGPATGLFGRTDSSSSSASVNPSSELAGSISAAPVDPPKKPILSMFTTVPVRQRKPIPDGPLDMAMRLAKLRDNARLICLASLEQSPLCRTLREEADHWKQMFHRISMP